MIGVYATLPRETARSVVGGVLGSTLPAITSLGSADAAVVHAMRDVAMDLMRVFFFNTLMSALVPAVMILWRAMPHRVSHHGYMRSVAHPVSIVLGLSVAGTVASMGLIHLVAFIFSLSGLAAPGVMILRATQAMAVATVVTPLTIIILSERRLHA